ncbi:MAG: hypothetical protein Q8777_02615 [Candidatus Phytoplasma stylosanthis]|uniref:hypothetical protein n=1 Tax=Candidatus Phytoplasma stylosanthis TaxID=2798314 RepID=UPI00293B8507|nr:hypothetical protein [Candidatus Phytoplasma stylosanthis]MDV3168220.1 hypothetical protein [Candidatus Phytoplasma stylosanthis]
MLGIILGWILTKVVKFCCFPSSEPKETEISSFSTQSKNFFLEDKINDSKEKRNDLEKKIKQLETNSHERFAQQQDWFERLVNLIKGLMVKVHKLEKMVPSPDNIPILEKEN